MHSSYLRGDDFRIDCNGAITTHAEFFAPVQAATRLGLLAPAGIDGLGAVCLILAYATAFYDHCRAAGAEFFAYPDFFTFQRVTPCVDYCMADIWPYHRNVVIADAAQASAEAIVHRGVNVLLVPDLRVRENSLDPEELDSLRRSVQRCFAYSACGSTPDATLHITCAIDGMREFALEILDSVEPSPTVSAERERWLAVPAGATVTQSYRELSLANALKHL